jgi:hypothetical protein
MSEGKPREWTLRELAAETGVAERTIRFYISKGLVEPPLRAGRRAAYGKSHRDRIRAVRELQARGMRLAEIGHKLDEGGGLGGREASGDAPGGRDQDPSAGKMVWFEPDGSISGSRDGKTNGGVAEGHDAYEEPRLAEPEVWRSYEIAPDVRVMLRTGVAPWRTKAVVTALGRFAAEVGGIVEIVKIGHRSETQKTPR